MNIILRANKSFDVENTFQSNAIISLFRFSKNGGIGNYISRYKFKIVPNVKFELDNKNILSEEDSCYIGICLSKFNKVTNVTVHYPLYLIDDWESDIDYIINDNLIEQIPMSKEWKQTLLIEDFIL